MDDPLERLAGDPEVLDAVNRAHAAARAEAAAWEELAARDRLRDRALDQVVREARDRGEVLAVVLRQRTFSGTVRDVGNDLFSLDTPTGRVDVRLGAALTIGVVGRGAERDVPGPAAPVTFLARLRECEQSRVEVGGAVPGGALTGVLEAVALDHVVLVDDDAAAWHVAHAAIDYLRPR